MSDLTEYRQLFEELSHLLFSLCILRVKLLDADCGPTPLSLVDNTAGSLSKLLVKLHLCKRDYWNGLLIARYKAMHAS
jgi:hypothetical protein